MPLFDFQNRELRAKVIHARVEAFVEAEVFCESPVTIPACHTHMIFFLKLITHLNHSCTAPYPICYVWATHYYWMRKTIIIKYSFHQSVFCLFTYICSLDALYKRHFGSLTIYPYIAFSNIQGLLSILKCTWHEHSCNVEAMPPTHPLLSFTWSHKNIYIKLAVHRCVHVWFHLSIDVN